MRRTKKEIAADAIDCELCRLEHRVAAAELGHEARRRLSAARVEVRKHMHPDDRARTPH